MLYRFFAFLLCVGCSVSPLYDDHNESSGAGNIGVGVIGGRDGQMLRGFLVDSLRDMNFVGGKYHLAVTLRYNEKPFAIATDSNAKRVRLSYCANVTLRNQEGKVVFNRPIFVHTSGNISSSQGEVILSLYGRNNGALIKELSRRIIENLKVSLAHES